MRTYNLAAVLSYGPIIASDETGTVAVTWNESLTLNSWVMDTDGRFRAVDCRTLGDVPTLEEAKERAQQWLAESDDE